VSPVYFLRGGRVLAGRVVNPGETHELPHGVARLAVESGECRYTVRIKILRDHMSIQNKVCAAGDIEYTDSARALALESIGAAEIVQGLPSQAEHALALAAALAEGDHERAERLARPPVAPAPKPPPPRPRLLPTRADADAAR